MFQATIGLEIHCEVKTKNKMFCHCLNDASETQPNKNICPICLAHPGCLPVINQEAVEKVVKLGLALNGKINTFSYFDRKSYFYPDLPKGFQISQYEKPLVYEANLNNIRIKRIHLEEDTGRLVHLKENEKDLTLVDFNRAGVPLLELVTEPDFKNAEEVINFSKELQLILRYLDISEADMEKGQLRIEVNLSLNYGTKVELKNINSFKAVYEAINYEIKRQEKILKEGGKVIQETRGWNDKLKITESQRFKEEAHDYRYFKEPDLPPLNLEEFLDLKFLKDSLTELPQQKRIRFKLEYNLNDKDIEILVAEKTLADYFEKVISEYKNFLKEEKDYSLILNYLLTDLRSLMLENNINFEQLKFKPENFAHLIYLLKIGKLNSRLTKDILKEMFFSGEDPENLIQQKNINLIQDEVKLRDLVLKIINENPQAVADYKKGKLNAIKFLIGKAMALTKGQAQPENLEELFKKLID